MKRAIAIVLGMMIVLSLAACGGNNKQAGNKDNSEPTQAIETKKSTEAKEEQKATVSETDAPETEAAKTKTNETEAPKKDENKGSDSDNQGIIRADIKEAIDSYEAFVDEYCEFVKNYDSTDMTMLNEYMDLVSKEVEMTKEFKEIENKDLNDAEALYYSEVSLRCSQKLLEAAKSLN